MTKTFMTAVVTFACSLSVPLGAAADPIAVYELIAPGPADGFNIVLRLENHGAAPITSATFDVSRTEANAPGAQPLVIQPPTFVEINGTSGATTFSAVSSTEWRYQFSSFLAGQFFQFNWDPDIASDESYGAVVSEQRGLVVRFTTATGTLVGVFERATADGGFRTTIPAPAAPVPTPEPASLALVAVGVWIAGLRGWREHAANAPRTVIARYRSGG